VVVLVRSLEAVHFRNIERASLAFSDTFNFITGPNASGKTNLLEAIHLFSLGRSFRTRHTQDVISLDAEYFFLKLTGVSDRGVTLDLEIGVERGGQAKVSASGAKLSGLGEIIGIIPSVLFVPEDVLLAAGPPRLRRLFIDYTAAQISPVFLADLRSYRSILKNRNALLRAMVEGRSGGGELAAWDEMLVEKGAAIARGRTEILGEVLPHVEGLCAELLPAGERLDMRYVCSFNEEGTDPARAMRNALDRCRDQEMRRGYTLAGPHYDDVVIHLGDTELRRYGSQGRKRLTAVILKLAQAKAIMASRGERPIVLLDDIFSELDGETAERVKCTLTDRYQSFVTSPRVEDFAGGRPGGGCFVVEGGRFRRANGEGEGA
jgi:DNA replication and repair protein RecF